VFDAMAGGDGIAIRNDAMMSDGKPHDGAMSEIPTLVAQSSNYATGPVTLSATVPGKAGDLLVMTGAGVHSMLTSVGGGGATWTRAALSTNNENVEAWYGVADGSSGTVTISLTGNTKDIWMVVSEWSGIHTAAPLDIATATSGLASPATASLQTTNAHDLLILAITDATPNTFGTPAPGTWLGLTPIDDQTFADQQHEWYQVVTATGRFTPTVSDTANQWEAALVAFRAGP
jgi:hypothetical protein